MLNSEQTPSVSAKYKFPWTPAKPQTEDSGIISCEPRILTDTWTSVPQRHISGLKQAIIETLRSN